MTTKLRTTPNLRDPDGFYERLLAAHADITPAQSAELNAALVLTLANHIGDEGVLAEALALTREACIPVCDSVSRGS